MFKNMKIGMRLGLGFGLVLTLLAATSLTSYNALNTASSGFTDYRGLARNTNNAGRVQANLLSVRMAALNYINTSNKDSLQIQKERFEKLTGLMESAISEAVSKEQVNTFKAIDEHLKVYARTFDNIVEKIERRHFLVKESLDVIGPQMERNLSDILVSARDDGDMDAAYDASRAVRNLLLARLYVTKFLDTNASSAAARVDREYKEFKTNLITLSKGLENPERRVLMSKILDVSEQYLNSFHDLVNTITERNTLKTSKLDPAGQQSAKLAEDLKLAIKGEQDILGPLLQASNERSIFFVIGMSLLAVLLGILITFLITRVITNPIREAVEVANALAKGDLTKEINIKSTDETGQLLLSMKNMIIKLSSIINQVRGSSDNLSSAAEEVSATAQSMSKAANEQASSVEQTSASMEEMTASISQNTDNAKVTDGMAMQAATEAKEGGNAVEQTVDAMKQIAAKICIIDEIAYQTNLLALNAAIEAARAGEHGKGFAVVAAEVRKLAERSQVAAQEIGEVATSSVTLAEKAGELLGEIVPSINKTSDLVQEISAASEEQSAGVGQINSAMMQLNHITQQNASSSEELSATSEEMSIQAQQLQAVMGFFTIEHSKPGKDIEMNSPKIESQPNNDIGTLTAHMPMTASLDESEFVKF